MASSPTCKCGAEQQAVNHVTLECSFYKASSGTNGPEILDKDCKFSNLPTTCQKSNSNKIGLKRKNNGIHRFTPVGFKTFAKVMKTSTVTELKLLIYMASKTQFLGWENGNTGRLLCEKIIFCTKSRCF